MAESHRLVLEDLDTAVLVLTPTSSRGEYRSTTPVSPGTEYQRVPVSTTPPKPAPLLGTAGTELVLARFPEGGEQLVLEVVLEAGRSSTSHGPRSGPWGRAPDPHFSRREPPCQPARARDCTDCCINPCRARGGLT